MTPTDANFGEFGGEWSDVKLEAVKEYFAAYNTALSQTSFTRIYIDGFAGGGRVKAPKTAKEAPALEKDLFAQPANDSCESESTSEEVEREVEQFRHGSPLLALKAYPGFHRFIFIEQNAEVISELKRQVAEVGTTNGRPIEFICQDANLALADICGRDWKSQRATLFLDPFALHIHWETLAKIAQTEAMDMWMLFPAMAVNRMMPRSGVVPDAWAKRLDETFGDSSWRLAFYEPPEPPLIQDMFPDTVSEPKAAKVSDPFRRLSEYVTARLKTIFAEVVDEPLILKTSSGSPLFLLCFAVANKRGGPIAKRIAKHIINKQRHGH